MAVEASAATDRGGGLRELRLGTSNYAEKRKEPCASDSQAFDLSEWKHDGTRGGRIMQGVFRTGSKVRFDYRVVVENGVGGGGVSIASRIEGTIRHHFMLVGSFGDWDWRGNNRALRISSKGSEILSLLFVKAGVVAM